MLFLPDGISELPMPRYFENALWLLTGRTRIPLPSLSNSSLSPLRTPSTRRISRGTVICPLLVIVACFCIVSPHSPYFTTNALLSPTRDSGRSRVTDASQRLTRRHSSTPVDPFSSLHRLPPKSLSRSKLESPKLIPRHQSNSSSARQRASSGELRPRYWLLVKFNRSVN
jgi:hypothetical protein